MGGACSELQNRDGGKEGKTTPAHVFRRGHKAYMSLEYWSNACASALSRPLQQMLDITVTCSGITIAAFCLCAALSGWMNLRWRSLTKEGCVTQTWRLYGKFTALIFCGSCAGAIA